MGAQPPRPDSVAESEPWENIPATRENIERLFKQHNENLLRFLRVRGHSPQEARDLAQEAYVQILGLGDKRTVNFLYSYLFTTASNLSASRRRNAHRRRELDELIFFEVEDAKSPEHACAAQSELAAIHRVLKGLPADMARAFTLMKFDDMTSAQVAKLTGLHHRKVRRYAAVAMKLIYEALHK